MLLDRVVCCKWPVISHDFIFCEMHKNSNICNSLFTPPFATDALVVLTSGVAVELVIIYVTVFCVIGASAR